MDSLQSEIERLSSLEQLERKAALAIFLQFRDELTEGKIRAAEKRDGEWQVNAWVKQGILLGFRLGELSEMGSAACLSFVDKDTFPARKFALSDQSARGPGRVFGADRELTLRRP